MSQQQITLQCLESEFNGSRSAFIHRAIIIEGKEISDDVWNFFKTGQEGERLARDLYKKIKIDNNQSRVLHTKNQSKNSREDILFRLAQIILTRAPTRLTELIEQAPSEAVQLRIYNYYLNELKRS